MVHVATYSDMCNYIYWIVTHRYIDIVAYTFYTYHTTVLSFYMEKAHNSSAV